MGRRYKDPKLADDLEAAKNPHPVRLFFMGLRPLAMDAAVMGGWVLSVAAWVACALFTVAALLMTIAGENENARAILTHPWYEGIALYSAVWAIGAFIHFSIRRGEKMHDAAQS